jgi:hypothetical protein
MGDSEVADGADPLISKRTLVVQTSLPIMRTL